MSEVMPFTPEQRRYHRRIAARIENRDRGVRLLQGEEETAWYIRSYEATLDCVHAELVKARAERDELFEEAAELRRDLAASWML